MRFMQIQAKPTAYNGYLFRSKLEAKWAVFLDTLSIPYVYEPEAFICSDGSQYTPDFYLPTCYLRDKSGKGVYLEIKPLYWQDDRVYVDRIQSAFNDEVCAVLMTGDPYEVISLAHVDDNQQLSPHWDNCMVMVYCEQCGALKFEYNEGNYMECPLCESRKINMATACIAADVARSFSFRFTQKNF